MGSVKFAFCGIWVTERQRASSRNALRNPFHGDVGIDAKLQRSDHDATTRCDPPALWRHRNDPLRLGA
jgi:hypothetical protein